MANSYKDLIVWKKSMKATKDVYVLTKKLPREELYSLTNQIRRAAVSVPSNIAEGNARGTKKDYANFLRIALGSKAELETQLLLAVEIGYLKNDDIENLCNLLDEIGKMLNAMIKKLIPNP